MSMTGRDNVMGNIGFTLVGHDLEEFKAVVERHGAWNDDVLPTFQMVLPAGEAAG